MKLTSAFKLNQTLLPTKIGTVEKTIAPSQRGRIRFQATYWPAQLNDTSHQSILRPGDRVKVVGRIGITLLVSQV